MIKVQERVWVRLLHLSREETTAISPKTPLHDEAALQLWFETTAVPASAAHNSIHLKERNNFSSQK
jgi:hypothetical protein